MVTRVTGAGRLVTQILCVFYRVKGRRWVHESLLSCHPRHAPAQLLPELWKASQFNVLCCLLLTKPLIPINCLKSLPCAILLRSQPRKAPNGQAKFVPHLMSFQKGTRILSRQFYRTGEKKERKKKKGLNHTVINREVIMPVWKSLI